MCPQEAFIPLVEKLERLPLKQENLGQYQEGVLKLLKKDNIKNMYKTLIYNNIEYPNFKINEYGDVLNLKTNKVLKKSISKNGYYHITLPLGKRGKVKGIRVHKAVAETFIPNPHNLPIVNHIDENKLNCRQDNLEWVTSKENTNKHWEIISKKQDKFNNRKLTQEDVVFIRNSNMSNRELAKIFNVSHVTISNVRQNKYYTEL